MSDAANEPDYGAIDVPETPTTDEEIAKLPVLDLDKFTDRLLREHGDTLRKLAEDD